MDDIVARPRYSRRSVPTKRRKRSTREDNVFIENLMRQVVFALIILAIVGVIKSVNTPVTNFLTDKIKYSISQDIQIKEIYTKLNAFFDNLFKANEEKSEGKDSLGTDETVDSDLNADLTDTQDVSTKDDDSSSNEIQNKDQEQDEETTKIIDSMKSKYSFLTPVQGTVTSNFGQRIHPVWKTEVFHSGVDLESESGVPIKAALAGTVIEASNSVTYGKYIKMEHEDGIITLYGHCSKLLAKKGQKIEKGATIAKVGNTGVSVGTHLHFEVWKDGKALDPLDFIKVPD